MNQQAMLRKIQKMQKEMMDTQKQIEESVPGDPILEGLLNH